MDDDRTEPVALPGDVPPPAAPAAPVPGAATPDAPGLPPPPPAPPAPSAPPVGWRPPGTPVAVGPAPRPPRLEVGAIVGRTFDTFGREWSLFLLFSLPAGIVGFLSSLLTPSMQASIRTQTQDSVEERVGFFALSIGLSLLSLFGTIGTVIVTDAYWRGTPIGVGDAVRRAVGQLPRAIGLFLVFLLIVLAISIPAAIVVVIAALLGAAAGLGTFLLLVAVIVVVAVAIWASLRITPMYAVLLLERVPVSRVIGRAWALSRGNGVPLLGVAIVMGLATFLPTWGSMTFNLFVDDRLIAGIATGLSTLVVAPVGVIWTVLAWATLAGAPYHDNEVMTTGKGRSLGFLIVAAVGIMLLVTGGTIAAEGSREFLRLIGG